MTWAQGDLLEPWPKWRSEKRNRVSTGCPGDILITLLIVCWSWSPWSIRFQTAPVAEQTLTNAQSSPSAASVIATEVQNSCVLHFDTFCMSYKCLVQFWKMMLLSVFYVSRSTNQRHVLPSETFPFTKSISTSGFLSGAWRRATWSQIFSPIFTRSQSVKKNNNTSIIQHWKMRNV